MCHLQKVDDTLVDGCGNWEHLHSFREVKCLQGCSKTLWMGIKILWLFISGGMKFLKLVEDSDSAYCFGYNPGVRGEHPTIQLLWATARPLVTRVSLIYLRNRWVFLVTAVNQVNRIQGESKIPLCNSSGGKLLLRPSSSYNKLLGRKKVKAPRVKAATLEFCSIQ